MEKISIIEVSNMSEEETKEKVILRKEPISTSELYQMVMMTVDSATNPDTGMVNRFFLEVIANVVWAMAVTENVDYGAVGGEGMNEFCDLYDVINKNIYFVDEVFNYFPSGLVGMSGNSQYMEMVEKIAHDKDVYSMSNLFVVDTIKTVTEKVDEGMDRIGELVAKVDEDRLMESIEKFLDRTSEKFPDFNNERTLTLMTKLLSLIK